MDRKKFISEMLPSKETIITQSNQSDVAIITIGRSSGEFHDRLLANDYALSNIEQELITSVADIFHKKNKPIIVLLNIGGIIEIDSWRDKVDAILLTRQGGQEYGNAVADILSGNSTPSGKLATTFLIKYNDIPSHQTFPAVFADTISNAIYNEGIYVGYRYFNTFKIKTAYEFGYGLSYTTFRYDNLKLSYTIFNGQLEIEVTVTNTGKTAGKEIVQIYVNAPEHKLEKPSVELKAFSKSGLLQPGQSEILRFTLTADELASFDSKQSAWIIEKGMYNLFAGVSSLDFRQKKNFE